MPHYNKEFIEREIINFCRFPVPRSPIEIVRYLKAKDLNFYKKTPNPQIVKFLRKDMLDNLVKKGILVKYDEKSLNWIKARKLLSYYESRNKDKASRKLTELYQINFFYLADSPLVLNIPILLDINLDIVALLYNLTRNKHFDNFFFELVNLLYCYDNLKIRDKIRIELYNLSFNEKEIGCFEKLFEYTNLMQEFFNLIPFNPNLQKALDFLREF